MDCTKAKTLLNEHIDGVLQDESRALVEDHLRSCASCGYELRELLLVRSAFKSALPFRAPEGFSSRVMEKIKSDENVLAKEPGLFRWLWDLPMHLKLAEAAAAVIVTVMGIYSAGFLSDRLLNVSAMSEQTEESLQELASLEQLDMVPPGSMGDMYLSIEENWNER